MILIVGIFGVAEARINRKWLAGFSFLLGSRTNFPGYVPQIPVIHDVEDACKLGTIRVVIVDIVVDGNKPHTHPSEVHFCIKARLYIVATNTAHVLDQHRLDNASFNVCQQLLPARTVKVATAVTIIRIVPTCSAECRNKASKKS